MAETRNAPSMIRWRPSERAAIEAALRGEAFSEFVRIAALQEAKNRIGLGAMLDAGMALKAARRARKEPKNG